MIADWFIYLNKHVGQFIFSVKVPMHLRWCIVLAGVLQSTLPVGTLGAYDPSRIVANITSGCPIPNEFFPPEQYSTDTLITVFAPLAQSIPRQECAQQAPSLAVCAFDGSLGVKTGCCSTACSAQMAQVNNLNCFPDILSVICQATPDQLTQIEAFVPVLVKVGENCVNYQTPSAINCPDGRTIQTGSGTAGAVVDGAGALAAEPPMPELGAAPATGLPGSLPAVLAAP